MNTLRRTELRHKLLAEVVNLQARLGEHGWNGGHGYNMSPVESACLTRMQNEVGIVRGPGTRWDYHVTQAALDLLSEWDTQHGKVEA